MINNNEFTADVRLGKDPETAFTTTGTQVTKCTAAISMGKKDEEKPPWWIALKAWKYQAEVLATCKKGDALRVSGFIDIEHWEKDGEQKSAQVLVCNSITKAIFPRTSQDKPQSNGYPG